MLEIQEILPTLHQIGDKVNLFVIDDGEDGLIMIDVGLPRQRNAILAALAEIGHQPNDLSRILITHADVDHIGSLAHIAQSAGAEVYAGVETADHIHNRTAPDHLTIFMRPLVWLVTKAVIKGTFVHQIIKAGDVLPLAGGIQVIAAPGHTSDNLVYYWEREKVLFAADLLNTQHEGRLGLTPARSTWNMDKAKESTRKILEMFTPRFICVGHGPFVDLEKNPEQLDYLKSLL